MSENIDAQVIADDRPTTGGFFVSKGNMTDRLRKAIPSLVLLCVAIVTGIWSYLSGFPVPEDTPILNLESLVLLVVVGLVAGLLGGLIGTGGCSVILPILHFWLGYPAPVAIGSTLFAVIFTATSGGYGHLVRRNMDRTATLWLSVFGLVGVAVGSWLFTLLAVHVALLGFVLGLAFALPALRMISEGLASTKKPQQEGSAIPGSRPRLGVLGFVIGILTGVLGLGGGYALVPSLIYLFGAPVYVTMGTSLLTMIPLALFGGAIKLVQGFVALTAALTLGAGATVGAQFAASVIKRIRPSYLKLLFGVYFLYVALKFILGYFGIMIW